MNNNSRAAHMVQMAQAKQNTTLVSLNDVPIYSAQRTHSDAESPNNLAECSMQTIQIMQSNDVDSPTKPTTTLFSEESDFDDSDKDPNYTPLSNDVSVVSESSDMDTQTRNTIIEGDPCVDIIAQADKVSSGSDAKESIKSRKQKRNSGKQYLTRTGKRINQRFIRELDNCRKKCKQFISPDDQKAIFEDYWNLGSHSARLQYLSGLIEVRPKKSERIETVSQKSRNRTHTNYFFFVIRDTKINVCQKCFLYTICESEQIIKTVAKKKLESRSGCVKADQRGRHLPGHKLPDDTIQQIRHHINSFPSYESHYTRERSAQKYFSSDLTLQKMHKLYNESHPSSISYTKYTEIFQTMGIKFKKPKKDRCNKCEVLNLTITVTKDQLQLAECKKRQEAHHKEADGAYKAKNHDKMLAQDDVSRKVLTFDLQKCLPTPNLETSVSFYKRLLWTYNLTVHDCVSGEPVCMMWHEGIAQRGGNEIASCLLHYLKLISDNCKNLTLYSDSCSGQNKNKFVAVMFILFMQEAHAIEVIDHKFLVPGHTHMECDVDHSLIERKKKKTHTAIHHPRDWYQFVRSVGSKRIFKVEEMQQSMFYSFSSIFQEKFVWRKTDESGNKFVWNTVKWLRYTKTFGLIEYKNTLDPLEPFKCINIKKRGITSLNLSSLKPCYTHPVKISSAKKKDLLDLLNLVDPIYHEFYKHLATENQPDYHPDITEESEDEN